LALCQVLTPPTAATISPVIAQINSTINMVTPSTNMPDGSGANSGTSTTTKPASNPVSTTANTGVTNNGYAKKLYCN
jgi:hypothetical protein